MNDGIFAFMATVLIINLLPGPAMLFVIEQSRQEGIRAGWLAVIGVELGVLFYVVLTALGLSAIFSSNQFLYQGLQILGACYLIYLAWMSYPKKGVSDNKESAAKKTNTHKNSFYKALFINLTNPKIALFFLALMPQFISSDSDNATMTFLLYGAIFNIGGIIVNGLVAVSAHKMSAALTKMTWLDYVAPLLFTCISLNIIRSFI